MIEGLEVTHIDTTLVPCGVLSPATMRIHSTRASHFSLNYLSDIDAMPLHLLDPASLQDHDILIQHLCDFGGATK